MASRPARGVRIETGATAEEASAAISRAPPGACG